MSLSLQIGNVCYMPVANPSIATECLLCISRGNCRRTTFVIFFMSKVGNLWKGISSALDSFCFGSAHQLPPPARLLLCFFLGWWHLQPYSVTIWTWIITHWSVWCTLTLLSKKHWRLLNYLVTLFPFVTLGRKVYSSVHKLHVGPSELCPVVCQFSQENVLWCFMVHLFASEKAASTCRWLGKFSFLEIAICQTNNTWFSPASNRFLPATSGRWMFLNDTSNKQALPLLKA